MRTSTFFGALAAARVVSAVQPPLIPGMKLTWHDSFDGCAGCDVNTDEWELRLDIDHNNELQTYTESNKNIQLSGGKTLQIVPWREDDGWSSARVDTRDSWTPESGKKIRFQAGVRMGEAANRQGLWPAFWMLGDSVRHGTDWPMCGELDIFEQVNGIMEGYGTVHCGSESGGICDEPNGIRKSTIIPNNDFHDWSLEIDRTTGNWMTESIVWSMDGIPFQVLTGLQIGDEATWSTLAHSPFFMILNIAVGGDWPGDPTDATEDGYDNMMEVEYAAVYTTE